MWCVLLAFWVFRGRGSRLIDVNCSLVQPCLYVFHEMDIELSLMASRGNQVVLNAWCVVAGFFVPLSHRTTSRLLEPLPFALQLDEAHARALKAEEDLEASQKQLLVRIDMQRGSVCCAVPKRWRLARISDS